ncbi:aminotransferase class III-fold pyridoxal phosphate-dependent enzyme [Formosa haliotis]|uniref:aminotransferase class III-fold pyridoxal phosphate-dependent enzyme n=1 Tax=Formosa haliotis TaxID=1555194 RepID=UPI0008256A11|nr:aminotransferase class III-fold pyridoxal phosphate-dependent enzyme [Formosa haliotis]
MEQNTLALTVDHAKNIASDLYGISGFVTPLPGEVDYNFKIKTAEGLSYILKVSRPGESKKQLEFQQELLQHLEHSTMEICTPKAVPDNKGNLISSFTDASNQVRFVRVLTWISGRLWSRVNPQLDDLRFSLGEQCGRVTSALNGFNHPEAHKVFDWDVAQSLWTKQQLHLFSSEEKQILKHFISGFEATFEVYNTLRKSIVHNDANDNNVIVSSALIQPKVIAVIDYGDAVYTQIINDVAIACAYAIMHHQNPLEAALPLVKGYHKSYPLQELELEHLYHAIAMRLVISVTKSAINKIEEPENTYLLISEKPAWELLKKWRAISPEFAQYSFRAACGFNAHPNEKAFYKWIEHQNFSLTQLFPTIKKQDIAPLDLSVSSAWIGHQEEFNDLDVFQFKLNTLQKQQPSKIIAGGYLEPRPLYTSTDYDTIGNSGRTSRTIHLGVDYWLPAQMPIHALCDGEVIVAVNAEGDKNYGGLIILKHQFENNHFYTLYGHLSIESALSKKVGDIIKQGECIGCLGTSKENGNWAPHLHFQVMLSMLNYTADFRGVTYYKELSVWKSICPNPNAFFKLDKNLEVRQPSNADLIAYRKQHLGKGLSLQYNTPIKMVRGAGVYLMDENGAKYLDTVNNVAHVGHEHFEVVKAGQYQMALINTNTRYLHPNINKLTEALLETLPPELSVLHFVNSGSEANELAIRMAKTVTGERDIIASEMGYHGNSNMCIDISSYKFEGKGGQGAPEYTHIIPIPDAFRGTYRGKDTGKLYAENIDKQIDRIQHKNRGLAAFIIEPIISCGGQIELPEGFLKLAYQKVRAAGGLCISDEVQTGCGRMGKTFWGFQLHDVIPDIVTIGKPLGNGHPLAAVACTREVADTFANGMEYFNTFGGNPVSCAIGTEVLQIIKREQLQKNALTVGEFLKAELKALAVKYPIIGDVRGQGLFLGIELVDANLKPLAKHTDYLANRMKDHSILMSIDGPDHNVLKIKPPLVFSKEHAKELLFYLERILAEDFMKHY